MPFCSVQQNDLPNLVEGMVNFLFVNFVEFGPVVQEKMSLYLNDFFPTFSSVCHWVQLCRTICAILIGGRGVFLGTFTMYVILFIIWTGGSQGDVV